MSTETDEHTPTDESTSAQGVKWGVFATIVVLAIGYIIIRDTDIQWSGFIAMLAFYALFYYIGAVTAGKRSGSSRTRWWPGGRYRCGSPS